MPSRGRYWDDFKVGERLVTGRRTGGGARVAHGILTLAVSSGQQNLSGWFEGTALALLGLDRVRFTAPVKFGDAIHTEMTVSQTRASSKPDRGVVTFDVTLKNQRGDAVCTYETSVLMQRRP